LLEQCHSLALSRPSRKLETSAVSLIGHCTPPAHFDVNLVSLRRAMFEPHHGDLEDLEYALLAPRKRLGSDA